MIVLDIILKQDWYVTLGIIISLIVYIIFRTYVENEKGRIRIRELENRLRNNEIELKTKSSELKAEYQKWAFEENEKFKQQELIKFRNSIESEVKVIYQDWAHKEFEKFKKNEIQSILIQANNQAREAALVSLQKWKIENEASIRQDAISRSYSVNLGKISEHLIPFHIEFPFNPQDARFIGSPIDMIVFDGHSEKKEEIIIYIVEVKTGNSRLTEMQKKIKSAVLKGEIRWAEIHPGNLPNVEFGRNKLSDGDQLKIDL